jgi:hypothetical protein
MTDFLKDCYLNGFCKGRKNFVPTPRYAKKLRAMLHSAESGEELWQNPPDLKTLF